MTYPRDTKTKKGDTIVEVCIAISIFAMTSILAITVMNVGMNKVQANLELIMARNEIDAQAEALRFVHNEVIRENRNDTGTYTQIWKKITSAANPSENSIGEYNVANCSNIYDTNWPNNIFAINGFAMNTRNVGGASIDGSFDRDLAMILARDNGDSVDFTEASLYPRLIFSRAGAGATTNDMAGLVENDTYNVIAFVEGIYVVATVGMTDDGSTIPWYYDFQIRTCWTPPGQNVPATLATIIRLYNPEYEW
jgi:type II secretory pathway pseudopilin PulG